MMTLCTNTVFLLMTTSRPLDDQARRGSLALLTFHTDQCAVICADDKLSENRDSGRGERDSARCSQKAGIRRLLCLSYRVP